MAVCKQIVMRGYRSKVGSNINHICTEVLIEIFRYLDIRSKAVAAQVCKRWRDIVYTKQLWANYCVNVPLDNMRRGMSKRLTPLEFSKEQASFISNVAKRGIVQLTVRARQGIGEKANLDLHTLYQTMPNLEVLIVVPQCQSKQANLPIYPLSSLPDIQFKSLRSLSLEGETGVDADTLKIIVKCMPNLYRLSLKGCVNVDDASLLQITKLSSLKTVDISETSVSDRGIAYLCGTVPDEFNTGFCLGSQLRDLSMEHCHNLTSSALQDIGTSMHSLRFFNINHNFQFKDSDIKHIAKIKSLKHFMAHHCCFSDETLKVLAKENVQLETLFIPCNRNVSDTGIKYFLQGFPSLLHISLACTQVSDVGVAFICANAPQLRYLDLNSLNITDSSLDLIGTKLTKLDRIALSMCNRLTNKGKQQLKSVYTVRGMPNVMDVSGILCKVD